MTSMTYALRDLSDIMRLRQGAYAGPGKRSIRAGVAKLRNGGF
jgi:hypothetical protein